MPTNLLGNWLIAGLLLPCDMHSIFQLEQ